MIGEGLSNCQSLERYNKRENYVQQVRDKRNQLYEPLELRTIRAYRHYFFLRSIISTFTWSLKFLFFYYRCINDAHYSTQWIHTVIYSRNERISMKLFFFHSKEKNTFITTILQTKAVTLWTVHYFVLRRNINGILHNKC